MIRICFLSFYHFSLLLPSRTKGVKLQLLSALQAIPKQSLPDNNPATPGYLSHLSVRKNSHSHSGALKGRFNILPDSIADIWKLAERFQPGRR